MSQMDGGEKAEFKGLPAASEEGGRLPSVLLSGIWLGFGNRKKKCGLKEGGKTNHRIKPWPAVPPAKPAPLLQAAQIPELNAIKPEFQKFFSSSRGIGLPLWVRILTSNPHKTGMVPLPAPAQSSPCIPRQMLGSPRHRAAAGPASHRLHFPSSPANSI